MAEPLRSSRRSLSPVAVALAAILLQLRFFDRWISLMDEGHILQYADLLRRGGELYRDATLIAFPGAFYLLAGIFEVFEPSIRMARWTVVLEFAAFAAFLHALLRGWISQPFALLGVALLFVYRIWAFPHWQMYSYSTTALTLIAASLVALVRHLEGGSRRWLGLAGFVTGLAVLCKQDYGGSAVLAMNAVLLIAARTHPAPRPERPSVLTQLAWFNGAGFVVGVALAAHYLGQGLLVEMLRQTIWNHLVGIATFEYSSLPPILPLFEQDARIRDPVGFAVYVPAILSSMDWNAISASSWYRETFIWDLGIKAAFWGPYAYVAFSLARVAWRRGALRDPSERSAALRELTLAAVGGLLILTLHKPKDWVHLSVMFWPLIALGTVHLHALYRWRPRLGRVVLALAALPLLILGAYTVYLAETLRARHDMPLRTARAGVYVTAAEEEVIGGSIDWITSGTEPGERATVLPYFPLIHFLAARDAPHRSAYVLWPVEEVPGRQAQIAAELESGRSPRVLVHFTQWVQFPRMDAFAPELFDYLVDEYAIEQVFTDGGWGYMLAGLRREHETTPGRALVSPTLDGVTLSVEGPDGPASGIAPSDHAEWARAQRWPFRPVLALRPHAEDASTVLSAPVELAPGTRLRTAIGVHPDWWFRFPPSPVHFAVRIVRDGVREVLFERELNPHREGPDRGWFDVSLPLDAQGAREVEIELVTKTQREHSAVFGMGGWAWPRLVGPDE